MAICWNILILVALCCIGSTRGKSSCPDGSQPVYCKEDPCRFATCPYFPEATCEADYCGGCNARFFVGKEEVTASCATGCPDGSRPVNCFVNPCDPRIAPTCDAYPNAVCQSDYCGGCNARFFVGKREVTDKCSRTKLAGICPDGSPPVNCFVNPCDPRIAPTCDAYPNAVCQSDYCGGCNARFFVGKREVTDMCSRTKLAGICPDGSPPVNCFVNPCDPRIAPTCDAYPNAVCQSDYCGGCNARFFVGKREVTDMCSRTKLAGTCPDGSLPVNCLLNPCDPRIAPTCDAYPNAVCQSDYCGGCNARFFVGKREVTDMCSRTKLAGSFNMCPIAGQVFQECRTCPATCEDPYRSCPDVCLEGCGCPFGQLIDVVNNRCVNPKQCPKRPGIYY